MKSSMRRLAFAASLSGSALAQMEQSDVSLIAWRAYGTFIKQYIAAGQQTTQGLDYFFVTPPTEYGIRGGTPVPEAVTNWDLQDRVDALQLPNSPMFSITGDSYVDSLRIYLTRALTAVPTLTADQAAQLNTLTVAMLTAVQQYQDEMDKATAKWGADAAAQAAKTPLEIWAKTKAPLYLYYRDQYLNAQARLDAYTRQVYGSDNLLISEKLDNIGKDKAKNEGVYIPGYNMPCFPGGFTPVLNPWPAAPVERDYGLVYRPLYTISGLEEACDSWFKGQSSGRSVMKLDMKNVKGEDWSSLGHSTSVKKGSAGLFGLISLGGGSTTTTTEFTQWSNNFAQEVEIQLEMTGAPLVFNIGAGFWDVKGVRQLYPTLSGADTLVGKIRTQKVLIGYGISLNMTFTNMTTYNKVYNLIQDTKKNASGGIRIFGFSFGAGGSGSYNRNVTDIQTSQVGDKGNIYIPPTAPGLTFMLGSYGQKM